MSTDLKVYLDHAAKNRELTVDGLVKEGYSRGYAYVLLHRLRKDGAAVSAGPGRVRLVAPGKRVRPEGRSEVPWLGALRRRFTVKETGFSVLPRRYGVPRPHELLLPPSQVDEAATMLRRDHPELQVSRDVFQGGGDVVCLYGGRVRGRRASVEEALVHVYRHAPRREFALALQAVLMERTDLNWDWLRRQPEWPELAGVFVAVNEQVGHDVFPRFRTAQAPDLSYLEIGTVAQPFTARGA